MQEVRMYMQCINLNYESSLNEVRMDYLSKFSITEPILSFVGRNDSLEDHLVKLYCVHAKAIKQCPDLRRVESLENTQAGLRNELQTTQARSRNGLT